MSTSTQRNGLSTSLRWCVLLILAFIVSGASSTLRAAFGVVPALLGGSLAPGTYTLLTYSGGLGGAPTFTWDDTTLSGYQATFSTATPGQVKITITPAATPPNTPSGL